jgi:LAS superfamily LD-carboxypeptidase LdcB
VNPQELTGIARTHIEAVAEPPCHLHRDAVTSFMGLRRAAAAAGLDLIAQSGFRDFARQLAIWNGKFSGERPLNDAAGRPLKAAALPPAERIQAILLWSALPGASRHHWGTDVDLIDGRVVAGGYRAQLIPEEFSPGGPFADLAVWLEAYAPRFGFFRPFRGIRSGVRPEPWHYSFAPVAEPARKRLTVGVLRAALEAAPLEGRSEVLMHIEELHQRYVVRIDWP